MKHSRLAARALLAGMIVAAVVTTAPAQDSKDAKTTLEKVRGTPPEFADFDKVTEGFEKVVSTADGATPMYTLWINKKKAEVLAELPKDFEKKKYFIALTVSSGERFAGLQQGDLYVQWKRYDKHIALIEPDLETRSTGDQESKDSVERLFTGRVIVDTPILTISPRGGPVIALDQLLTMQAPKFFGFSMAGLDPKTIMKIREIKVAKTFPKNVELAFEVPLQGGRLKSLHYSISEIPDNTGYKPRKADDRVGYFTTAYDDLGKYEKGQTRTRYINRWHLEKADPNLKLSPPKQPIVFYIEHTTPIRYRRFVRDGVLYWNKAFERVGIINAIEVYQQDAATKAHMDKDPEDVRYNFLRWLNNDVSTAIGPSRVHPLTGQILDADIVLTDGWIRYFDGAYENLLPEVAMEGFSPETLAWLDRRPNWDPRILLAAPQERDRIMAQRMSRGVLPGGGHPMANVRTEVLGDDEYDGLFNRVSQVNGACFAAHGKAIDLALARMMLTMLAEEEEGEGGAQAEGEKLDGMPAEFIGPLLADLVAHEVGHTLGLRHNFRASALYTLAEINSPEIKGQKPFASSVMDYLPININMKDGKVQGDYAMIGVGPYDMWAIEYGYTFEESKLSEILKQAAKPEHQFATDQDTSGPDPFARRYDFTAEPIDYAKNQTKLAEYQRKRLIEKFVKNGESWSEVRKGYELTLSLQTKSLSMMANWIGGTFVRREHKGDNGDTPPMQAVPVKQQRDALKWVIEHAFREDSFGLTPELLERMKVDHLQADESFRTTPDTFPIHDRVMGIQSSVLTMLMNPSTLRRIYDSEQLIPTDQDAFTMPELLDTLSAEIYRELDQKPNGDKFTVRQPMISSLRRNLQRVYVERLIDVAMPGNGNTAASKPISNLAMMHLRTLSSKIDEWLKPVDGKVDPYTRAHLQDTQVRITKALEAQYIFNAREIGGSFSIPLYYHTQGARCTQPDCHQCGSTPPPASWSEPPVSRR